MSGGYFDYGYYHLDQYFGSMEDEEMNKMIYDLSLLLKSLEWYKSGDTCEEDYQKDLKEFKKKYFKSTDKIAKEVLLEELKGLHEYTGNVIKRLDKKPTKK